MLAIGVFGWWVCLFVLVSWFVVSPGILSTVECLMMFYLVQHGSTFPICCPSNEDDAHPPAFFGKKKHVSSWNNIYC